MDSNIVGGPFTRIIFEPMNLNSSDQVKSYLFQHGWEPDTWNYKKDKRTGFVEKDSEGNPIKSSPKLTESSYDSVQGDIPRLLAKRNVLLHRKRLLSNTRKTDDEETGWLNQLREDGRVVAGAATIATNTHRCRHYGVVNVPSVERLYGGRIRSLFTVPEGYNLVGVDAAALEARMQAHYIIPFGGTELADILINGDIHQANADMWGCTRKEAKSPYYCVPMDTRALTKAGWKTYDELSVGELVLTYNQQANIKEWKPVLAKHYFEKAEVLKMECKGFKFRSTPDHRWFVKQRKWAGNSYSKINGRYMDPQVRTTATLTQDSNIINNAPMFPDLTSTYSPTMKVSKYGTDWTKIVCGMSSVERRAFLEGFFIADGHMTKSGKWCFGQNRNEHFEAVLTASFIEHHGKIGVWEAGGLMRCELNVKGHTTAQELRTSSEGEMPVWCITTENGSWVARQDDFITITGNCLMYGGQPAKLAMTMGCDLKDAKGYYEMFWEQYKPLTEFKEVITRTWEARGGKKGGYLKSIHGAKLYARSPHALVNMMFQSAGSVTVMYATIFLDKLLRQSKLDAHQVIHMHDEFQIEVLEKDTDRVVELALKSFELAGKYLKMNVPIIGEAKVGKNWAECH